SDVLSATRAAAAATLGIVPGRRRAQERPFLRDFRNRSSLMNGSWPTNGRSSPPPARPMTSISPKSDLSDALFDRSTSPDMRDAVSVPPAAWAARTAGDL